MSDTTTANAGTHCYIGLARCGCMLMGVVDLPNAPCGEYVTEAIKLGLAVSRVTIEECQKRPLGHSVECDQRHMDNSNVTTVGTVVEALR